MKISYIQNQKFGYNSEYHQQVENYLSTRKQYSKLANMLLDCDKFTLTLEDELCRMEKNPSQLKSKSFLEMHGLLGEIKSNIALYMEAFFPKLEYAKNLSRHYQYEISGLDNPDKISWRNELVKKVNYFIFDSAQSNATSKTDVATSDSQKTDVSAIDKKAETPEEQEDKIQGAIDTIKKEAVRDYEAKKAANIIEKFVSTESSPRGFDDVVGLNDIKQKFRDEIIAYVKNPELKIRDEEEYGIRSPRGFLFYGPPGCGKTFITQALAAESGLPMFKIDISKIGSAYVNQTAVNIQAAFEFLKSFTTTLKTPCILFLDEVDSLAMNRSKFADSNAENLKVVNTLLKLIEQARDNNIIVIAATNQFDLMDDAFKARFDSQIYLGLPDEEQIQTLLEASLCSRAKGVELGYDEEAVKQLTKELKGYSNRAIVFIIDEASKIAKADNRSNIKFEHVKQAIEKCDMDKPKEKDYIKNSKKSVKIGF